jgi:hypothetical protein
MHKILTESLAITSFLQAPDGLVLFSLKGCSPCDYIWLHLNDLMNRTGFYGGHFV